MASHWFLSIYHLLKANMNPRMPAYYVTVCSVCASVFVSQTLFIPTLKFMYDKDGQMGFQFPSANIPSTAKGSYFYSSGSDLGFIGAKSSL